METTTKQTETKTFEEIPSFMVKEGDIVYVSNKNKSQPYLVVQAGDPFFLLENVKTRWASLYHVDGYFYKLVDYGNESE